MVLVPVHQRKMPHPNAYTFGRLMLMVRATGRLRDDAVTGKRHTIAY
ncbi:hypothetical protein RUA4292_02545 [Ruegeria atlantica]|uniref:Uncharacterized protein n=1 Tax=Ruegeria atlantica TaxID=81569 RepID=A0A0P1EEJ5_9RHOB|nr:hypothetical protein RUA4292_02545 [Ruegeria atlantica]